MTIQLNLAELLEQLRTALEEKTVECPSIERMFSKEFPKPHFPHCREGCNGTSRIPDSQYASLLVLVRIGCPGYKGEHYKCLCDGSRYFTRTAYWVAAPSGALRGALEEAMPKEVQLVRWGTNTEVWQNIEGHGKRVVRSYGTDGQAAVQAVLEFVRRQP